MGNRSSHEIRSVATAKLVYENGQLQEFLYPVRVSWILKKNPNFFICKADDMNFDEEVAAIRGEKELELDQLYFALPLSWLNRPLRPPQMAALAVKASLALQKRVFSSDNRTVIGGDTRGGSALVEDFL